MLNAHCPNNIILCVKDRLGTVSFIYLFILCVEICRMHCIGVEETLDTSFYV